jgi:hypothetical protein
MTLTELEEHINIFHRRANDPQLSDAQRAAFQAALEGAEKQRAELLAAQKPAALPLRPAPQPAEDSLSGDLPVPPPDTVAPEPPALLASDPEKKTWPAPLSHLRRAYRAPRRSLLKSWWNAIWSTYRAP